MSDTPKVTIYRCTNQKCSAMDRDRGVNGGSPVTLNCWKCKGNGTMYPVADQQTGQAEYAQAR